jgi:predicted ATPase
MTDTPMAASTVEPRQPVLRHGHAEPAEEQYCKDREHGRGAGGQALEFARRRVEARDFLAPAYGGFTEGFDTRDLKDAKALLDDVGGS